jgi:hypothetical protein
MSIDIPDIMHIIQYYTFPNINERVNIHTNSPNFDWEYHHDREYQHDRDYHRDFDNLDRNSYVESRDST